MRKSYSYGTHLCIQTLHRANGKPVSRLCMQLIYKPLGGIDVAAGLKALKSSETTHRLLVCRQHKMLSAYTLYVADILLYPLKLLNVYTHIFKRLHEPQIRQDEHISVSLPEIWWVVSPKIPELVSYLKNSIKISLINVASMQSCHQCWMDWVELTGMS